MTAKRKKTRRPKRITIPKLEKKAWRIFSFAVRLLGTDEAGYCECVTCKKKMYYYGGTCHAGHFRPRTEKFVKYLFDNVHPQCATCNTFKDGEQFLHGIYIDERYGKGRAAELTRLGKLTFKNQGIDFRVYLEELLLECYKIIGRYGHLDEWKSSMNKTELKLINELQTK